jgi:Putative zinc-finger
MSCWRPALRKKLLLYLEGILTQPERASIESHLLKCVSCRDALWRMRMGRRMAQQIPRVSPVESPHAGFEASMIGVTRRVEDRSRRSWKWQDSLEPFATPRVVLVLAGVIIVQLTLFVLFSRKALLGERSTGSSGIGYSYLHGFRPITIQNIRLDVQPHIATEGYVENVHVDRREGVIAFRLVGQPNAIEPFVVCEIMRPMELAPPKDGSHVRVYGVSRYDAQRDHDWYEVNPVLGITRLPR